MNITYKKGEIVWAKIQGYSWWPGRITQIKLNLNLKKNRLGKALLEYEKEPLFYITFFPNDSICKIKPKYIKKFISGYQLRSGEKKRKKLQKAIHIATKAFLKENPDLSLEIKHKIFKLNMLKKKNYSTLKKFLALKEEEDEEQNDENDIQSFIDSEGDEIQNYKKELKNKKSDIYLNKKRKLSNDDKEKEKEKDKHKEKKHIGNKNNSDDEEYEDDEDNDNNNENDINIECNRKLKNNAQNLFKINIEVKRKNNINNIINILDNIENIINENNFDFDYNIIKDLLFILNNYTHYNNEIIMNKSIFLHKIILDKFIENIFSYSKIDTSLDDEDITNSDEYYEKINEEILVLLDKIKDDKTKPKKGIKEILKSRLESKDIKDMDNIIIFKNEIENSENTNTNNIIINNDGNKDSDDDTINNAKLKGNQEEKEKNYELIEMKNKIQFSNNEPYLKDILNNPNYFSKKIEGQLYPDNFFKEIYLKSNINSKTELLRKKMCLQLYNILKLVLPFCQEDIFKKNIIFLEYLARRNDPLFGNKYMTIINLIYNKIKLEAVKIRNKNKK